MFRHLSTSTWAGEHRNFTKRNHLVLWLQRRTEVRGCDRSTIPCALPDPCNVGAQRRESTQLCGDSLWHRHCEQTFGGLADFHARHFPPGARVDDGGVIAATVAHGSVATIRRKGISKRRRCERANLSSRAILESGRYLERGAHRDRGPSRRQDSRSGRKSPRVPETHEGSPAECETPRRRRNRARKWGRAAGKAARRF